MLFNTLLALSATSSSSLGATSFPVFSSHNTDLRHRTLDADSIIFDITVKEVEWHEAAGQWNSICSWANDSFWMISLYYRCLSWVRAFGDVKSLVNEAKWVSAVNRMLIIVYYALCHIMQRWRISGSWVTTAGQSYLPVRLVFSTVHLKAVIQGRNGAYLRYMSTCCLVAVHKREIDRTSSCRTAGDCQRNWNVNSQQSSSAAGFELPCRRTQMRKVELVPVQPPAYLTPSRR